MKLLSVRCWPLGPNLVALGLYDLRGWVTLFVWPFNLRVVAIPLPVRARAGW